MGTQPVAPGSPSIIGTVGGILGGIINDPQVKQSLINEILKFIGGLFSRSKPKPPVVPVTKPTPAAVQDDPDFPDDHIPVPVASRKVVSVKIGLARAQYSRERFPEKYTEDNKMGLYSDAELRAIQAGTSKLNYDSKFWLNQTAYDAQGHEFLRPAVLAYGLAFKTEHHAGDAYIVGNGATPEGGPAPGYQTHQTDEIGFGETAWESSLGFLVQFKAWSAADGGEFDCWGKVDGVESNHFTLKVS